MVIRFTDLFAGVGGFHYGLTRCNPPRQIEEDPKDNTNIKNEHKRSSKSFACVYSNEYDKYANSIYRKHFGECDNRDIREVEANEIPDHDLLCGGFPCQSFSVAGKRGGFADTRGTLFFEIARILKEKQPRLCLLENVKGLLSHDKGKTFSTIISTLDELGYDLQWQVLNSKNFGVPQNRERVFIVGHLRGASRPQVFPITEDDRGINKWQSTVLREVQAKERKSDSRHTNSEVLQNGKNGHIHQLNQPKHSNNRVFGDQGLSPTLNTMQGEMRQPFIALTETRTQEARRIRREMMKNGKDWSPRRGKELVPRNDDKANTVTAGQSKEHFLTNGVKIRRLTPLECERLQGFPDGWTEGLSDTQRYKCMGNAVTSNVITEIGKRILYG